MMNNMLNTQGIESTLKSYGITGNPYVDSMIYAQIVPVIFAFWSTMTRVFKKVFVYIVQCVYGYLQSRWISKISDADIVFYTEIKKCDALFYNFVLNNIIKNDDVKSDKNSTQFIDIIQKFMEEKKQESNTPYYEHYKQTASYKKWATEYELHINTDTTDGSKLSYTKSYKSFEMKEDICKTFVYQDLIIKMALMTDSSVGSKIEVTIFQLKSQATQKFKLHMFENFLEKRFQFRANIPIIQSVMITHPSLIQKMHTFCGNNRDRNTIANKLTCGNKEYISQSKGSDTKLTDGFASIKLSTKDNHDIVFDDTITDYNNRFEYEAYSSSAANSDETFDGLFTKYISSVRNDNYGYHYGFFCHNDSTILVYFHEGKFFVTFITYNKYVSLKHIKDVVNGIFTGKISNRQTSTSNKKSKRPVYIYKRVDKHWSNYELDIRTFESIYLPNTIMSEISREFEKFSQMKQLYKKLQIPYRKGILFYGPPGTGKTSLVKALAYEHQLNIYVINVNDSDINDDSIGNILSSIGKSGSKILLFEDIDSAFSDKEMVKNEAKTTYEGNKEVVVDIKEDKTTGKDKAPELKVGINSKGMAPQQNNKFLTYSGLLNALDGVLSGHEGVITVMTTNYIEKLGQAFLRPGRIDRKFMLTYCVEEQIYKMLNNLIKQRLDLMNLALKKMEKSDKDNVGNGFTFEIENMESNKKYMDIDFKDLKIKKFAKTVIESGEKYTPAQMQQYLVRNTENIDDIFDNVDNIKESYDCKFDSVPQITSITNFVDNDNVVELFDEEDEEEYTDEDDDEYEDET